MSLTLARSEREQNVLTHASLATINFYFRGVTVSNIRQLAYRFVLKTNNEIRAA